MYFRKNVFQSTVAKQLHELENDLELNETHGMIKIHDQFMYERQANFNSIPSRFMNKSTCRKRKKRQFPTSELGTYILSVYDILRDINQTMNGNQHNIE